MTKLRNVIITAVASLTVMFGGVAIYGTTQVKEAEQQFIASGYILDGSESRENGYAKLSFDAGTTYRVGYPDRVIFKDTAGVEVATDKTAFLHFSDGSLSALTDGVLVDLNNMTGGVLNNFRINAGTVLERRDNSYVIESLSGTLYLDDFIWKISETQYMLVSSTIDVTVGNQDPKYFYDAVELNYYNEGILMLVTEEGAYRTVATDCVATMNSGVKLDLASRTIIDDGAGTRMSMEQIILDADEVIDVLSPIMSAQKSDEIFEKNQMSEAIKIVMPTFEVINGEDGEDGEDGEAGEAGENGEAGIDGIIGQSGMTGADGLSGETGENGKNGLNGADGADGAGGAAGAPGAPGTAGSSGTNGANGRNGNAGTKGVAGAQGTAGRDGDTVLEEEGLLGDLPEQVVLPVFNFTNFVASSDSVNASINYEDQKGYLDPNSITVSLVRTADGRQIKMLDSYSGLDTFSSPFDVAFSDLVPEQEYTMQVSANYTIKNTEYTNVFISKSFFTNSLGIELNHVYSAENELAFMPVKPQYSTVESAKVTLRDLADPNQPVKEVDVEFGQEIVFEGLTPNRTYEVQFAEITFGNTNESIPSYCTAKYTTLKRRPVIGTPEVVVNKVEGLFDLRLSSVVDEDNGIQYYRYEIYETGNEMSEEISASAVKVKEIYASTNREVLCPVVDELKKNQFYRMRVVICFDDNEKLVEYTSIASGPFVLDGTGYPAVSFVEDEVHHESFKGTLYIDTNGANITVEQGSPIVVQYTSSTGVVIGVPVYELEAVQTGTESVRYAFPFSAVGLNAGDSYIISVYGTLNLNDGRGDIQNALIGRVVTGTSPVPGLQVKLTQDTENVNNAVAVKLSIANPAGQQDADGEHAARTANKLRINIYNGSEATGTPIVTKDFEAENAYDPVTQRGGYYEELYGEKSITFTEAEDSLNFNLNLLNTDQYTIEVALICDYTDYANEFILTDNVATFGKAAVRPNEEVFIANPLSVVPITNAFANNYGGTYNENLTADAIVGYYLKTNYGQLTGNEDSITYYAFEEANIAECDNAQEFYIAFANGTVGDGIIAMKVTKTKDNSNMLEHIVWFGDAATAGTSMKRGSKYVFTVRITMSDNSYFPSETKKVAKTSTYQAPYIRPNFYFVPWLVDPVAGDMTYRYKIVARDPDAVADVFTIPGTGYSFADDSAKSVEKNAESTITLQGAVGGRIIVQCEVKSFNEYYASTPENVIDHYVSAQTNAGNASLQLSYKYTHESSKNRIRISVTDASSDGINLKQVAALRLTVFDNTGNREIKTVPVEWNSVIGKTADAYIYYSQLEECKGNSCKIQLEAVFDTEVAGYSLIENAASAMVAIQTVESQKRGNYIIPNQAASDFIENESGTAMDSWYTVEQGNLLANSRVGFSHALSGFRGTMQLAVGSAGARLEVLKNNNLVILKQLTNVTVMHEKDNGEKETKTDFVISDMLPTITLNNGPVTYTIYPTADSARVDFIINGHKSLIEGGKVLAEGGKYYIYFDLWSIGSDGSRTVMTKDDDPFYYTGRVEMKKDVTKYVDNGTIPLIRNLEVNKKYGIALYYYDEQGNKQYPLDTYRPDLNGANIMFTFMTADEVQIICDKENVTYKAYSYGDKTIVASLQLIPIVGYDIVYQLVRKVGEDQYTTLLTGEELQNLGVIYKTTSILSEKKDIALKVNPGQLKWTENGSETVFTFGDDTLFLKATPVSKQDEEKELGKPCYIPLELSALKDPYYNLRIIPIDRTSVRVRVSITDADRVLVEDRYMIRIFNGEEDVTPESVKLSQFSSRSTQTFDLGNLSQDVTYKIKLYSILDTENAGDKIAIDVDTVNESNCLKTVSANTLTTYEYDFGQMSLVNTSVNNLALYFTDSVRLEDFVRYIQYTVVNPDGSYASYEWDSYKTPYQTDGNSIYADLNHSFAEQGEYTVQFRFLDAGRRSLGQDATLLYIKGY